MSALTDLLRAQRGGVVTVAEAAQAAARARAAGWRYNDVDLGGITDKQQLLHALADHLGFPRDYVTNWDALVDALRDVTADPGVVLLVRGERSLPEDLRHTLLQILQVRAEDQSAPMVVVRVQNH